MKKILLILLVLLTGLLAEEQATYTITGVKDKRLEAVYSATYVSQNLKSAKCSYTNSVTGYARGNIVSKSIKVDDGNYSVMLPIYLEEDENQCNYRFAGLRLTMRRLYDEDLSSIHYILSDKQEVHQIYWKTYRGAMGLNHPDTPPYLETDKKYFRIAKDTRFLCKTLWFVEHGKGRLHSDAHSQFHCTMQINSDVNRTLYTQKNKKSATYSHPSFGVNEIKDTNMSIDILVDDKNCKAIINRKKVSDHFRELEKTSMWNKIF